MFADVPLEIDLPAPLSLTFEFIDDITPATSDRPQFGRLWQAVRGQLEEFG